MVVNVDHSCPVCTGIGPCEVCGDSGIVRAPADQCTVEHTPCLDPETARQSLEDYHMGRYKSAAETVKYLRGENEAFEAGYKAGRAAQ